jgi:cytochrome c oxidase assembly protein subunit 15
VLAGAVTLQATLGIVTLLYQAPLPLALAHQLLAILAFTVAIIHAESMSRGQTIQLRRSVGAEQGA